MNLTEAVQNLAFLVEDLNGKSDAVVKGLQHFVQMLLVL